MLLRVAMQESMGDPGRRRRRGLFGKLGRAFSLKSLRRLAPMAASFLPGPFGEVAGLMGDPRAKVQHAARRGKHHILAKIRKYGGKAAKIARRAHHFEQELGLPEIDLSGIVRGVAERAGIGSMMAPHEEVAEAVAAGVHPAVAAAALGHRRRRSMHVTNVKALRRSMRRVQGFAKLARRVMTFTHTHKMKKRRKR